MAEMMLNHMVMLSLLEINITELYPFSALVNIYGSQDGLNIYSMVRSVCI